MDQKQFCKTCGWQESSKFKTTGMKVKVRRCIICDKARKRRHYEKHLAENAARHKRWCELNKDRVKEITNAAYHKCRLKALLAYSPTLTCCLCRESHIEFLAIDHIDGGGNQHRQSESISNICYWLKKHNYPDGFRVLCHNCNFKCKLRSYDATVLERLHGIADRAYLIRRKAKVISAYGNKCVCCGLDDIEVLSIDHINGGGTKHRRNVGLGTNFYRWIIKNNFPIGFRTLCLNCNISLGTHGKCPHNHLI
jgi:hypothetical protein